MSPDFGDFCGAYELTCFFLSHRIHGTGVFTYIYHKNQPNVGKYTIHGSFGYVKIIRSRRPSRFSVHQLPGFQASVSGFTGFSRLLKVPTGGRAQSAV